MHIAPTVIIVDTSKDLGDAPASLGASTAWLFSSLLTQIHRAMEAGLPVALVASSSKLKAIQGQVGTLPVTLAAQEQVTQEGLASALRTGVQACATSEGWILLPSDVPMLRPSTLKALSGLLGQHPVVYVAHRGQACMPMGFGQELFSELMRLNSDRELQRLVNRYPSTALEEEVGVLTDDGRMDKEMHVHQPNIDKNQFSG